MDYACLIEELSAQGTHPSIDALLDFDARLSALLRRDDPEISAAIRRVVFECSIT